MFWKKPVAPGPIIKTRNEWLDEIEVNKKIVLENVPKYRIYKMRDGTYNPQNSYASSVSNEWIITDFTGISTQCEVIWNPMRREGDAFTVLEEAEAWLAQYIADPEITYYNGPPLEKVAYG